MSKFVTYIPMKGYLRQWTETHFGNPAKFPPASVENAALRVLMTKLKGRQPLVGGDGMMTLELPDSKEKPVEVFNHLTEEGQNAIRNMLHNLFKIQLWNDLFPLLDPTSGDNVTHMPILDIIRNWCRENGIDTDSDYTIMMKWQRMREAHHFPMKVRISKKC